MYSITTDGNATALGQESLVVDYLTFTTWNDLLRIRCTQINNNGLFFRQAYTLVQRHFQNMYTARPTAITTHKMYVYQVSMHQTIYLSTRFG